MKDISHRNDKLVICSIVQQEETVTGLRDEFI